MKKILTFILHLKASKPKLPKPPNRHPKINGFFEGESGM